MKEKYLVKKINCKCGRIFMCDNDCQSDERTDCLCVKCYSKVSKAINGACEVRCKKLKFKPKRFIFR